MFLVVDHMFKCLQLLTVLPSSSLKPSRVHRRVLPGLMVIMCFFAHLQHFQPGTVNRDRSFMFSLSKKLFVRRLE